MAEWRLRSIPDALWRRVRDRARRDKHDLRDVLIDLLTEYADETDATSQRRRAGKARAESMTTEERSAAAWAAVTVRWAKHRALSE